MGGGKAGWNERISLDRIRDFFKRSEFNGAIVTAVVKAIVVAGGESGTCRVVVACGRLEEVGGGSGNNLTHTFVWFVEPLTD